MMRVADLEPGRTVFTTGRLGKAVHLHASCKRIGGRARKKKANQLHQDRRVCKVCSPEASRSETMRRHPVHEGDSLSRKLENMEPEDVGL